MSDAPLLFEKRPDTGVAVVSINDDPHAGAITGAGAGGGARNPQHGGCARGDNGFFGKALAGVQQEGLNWQVRRTGETA